MTAPDWAAKARERWPGAAVQFFVGSRVRVPNLTVYMGRYGGEFEANRCTVADPATRTAEAWRSYYGPSDSDNGQAAVEAPDPIAAIEAAIRAEQDEARATLERLKVWGVG